MTNAGDGASEATWLRTYMSTDSTITTSDTQVNLGQDVGAIAAAGTSSHDSGITAPSEAGTYYYGACVDSVTDESDTTNNCSSSVMITVLEPAPDFYFSRVDRRSGSIETGGEIVPAVACEQQGRCAVGGNNAAVEELDGRDDHDIRHDGWHGAFTGPILAIDRTIFEMWLGPGKLTKGCCRMIMTGMEWRRANVAVPMPLQPA